MSTTPKSCNVCRHSGLAIFFLRWGAVALDGKSLTDALAALGYASPEQAGIRHDDVDIAPFGAELLKSDADFAAAVGQPALNYSRYVLRALRQGYLHVYHEKAPEWRRSELSDAGIKDPEAAHWEIFRVKPSGALIPKGDSSYSSSKDFHCDDPEHIFTVMAYRLPQAHESGKIWIAFSANEWSETLCASNKMNPAAMECIDIPTVLQGTLPAQARTVNADWIDQHVAEFAIGLDRFQHGTIEPTNPLKSHWRDGARLARRFAMLDGHDAKTKGKSFVYALRDSVGLATDLADISAALARRGGEYLDFNEWGISTVTRLNLLRRQTLDAQAAQAPLEHKPMSSLQTDSQGRPVNAIGQPLFMDHQLKPIPPVADRGQWGACGTMRIESFETGKRNKSLPESARFFQLRGDPSMGWVFAPMADLADLGTYKGTAKIRRLHDQKAVNQFVAMVDKRMAIYAKLVDQYDSDRSTCLQQEAICHYFDKHFDSKDGRGEPPRTYMREANGALVSWGGIGPSTETLLKQLLGADPSGLTGWALRSMVANQLGLYSHLAEFWQYSLDWPTNPDKKLDKSYDTLKFLLFEGEKVTHKLGHLSARHPWVNGPGIGLSFGIMGFLAGAATHLLSKAIADAAPGFARNAQEAAARLDSFIDKTTGKVKSAAVAAELASTNKINAWCHNLAALLQGYLDKKPPARPVYVKVSLPLDRATAMMFDMSKSGPKFADMTHQILEEWNRVPAAVRNQEVAVTFLTTDQAIGEVRSAKELANGAASVHINVTTSAAALPVIELTEAQLGQLYREAHAFDGLKAGFVNVFDKALPQVAGKMAQAASVAVKVPTSAVRGATRWQGQFAFFGGWLQWRALQDNEEKIAMLSERLLKMPNLTLAQREAINDEILLAQLGMQDNKAGIAGGFAELVSVGAAALKLDGTKALAGTVGAFAGAAGAFANAVQNWNKAEGKLKEGDVLFANRYFGVAFIYGGASVVLVVNGVATIANWLIKRGALRVGAELFLTSVEFCAEALGPIAWGVTIIAFTAEGIVSWYDRTKMEAWVENCKFGKKPSFKTVKDQDKAFDDAIDDMRTQALREAKK